MAGNSLRPPARGVTALLLAALLVAAGCASLASAAPARLAALEPELGQLLLVGFPGTEGEGNADLERLLCQARVGGVLVFGHNVVDAEQLRRLTGWMRERSMACTGRPLLVAVDAEGGAVMRLSPRAGFPETLSHRDLGEANDFTVTELEARRIGAMLRAGGVNWNLAPVVDVGYNPANPVIVRAGRSFGANPRLVAAHAWAFVRGMRAEGVLTVLKHFPGHGSSFDDSHLGFVDVTETANRDVELLPYRALMGEGVVDSVMTAHVFNRWLDQRYPATLSRRTIAGLLRKRLGWDGLVLSDDLRMGAIEQHYGIDAAPVLALKAGVDMLLIANDRLPDGRSASSVALASIKQSLSRKRLALDRVASALKRVQTLKARLPAGA
ncbi:MAG: glycoside hydrolase family 3 [Candidatus Rokubacteria bacterium]|nr:glycoside hydrolase family 3 [Candidatus Rokubacteria bacterium]